MPRQQSAPSKEAALTESTLLSKLSVLQTEVLREVRQDRADISKKLQEIQEYQSRQEVSDMLHVCKTVEITCSQNILATAQVITFKPSGKASVEREQVCSSCMCSLCTQHAVKPPQ